MSNTNLVTITGRLTGNVELRQGANHNIAKFRIATGRVYRNKQENLVEETNFFNVKTNGRLARVCSENLSKGRLILVHGRLANDNYEKEGKVVYGDVIWADHVEFLDSPKNNSNNSNNSNDLDNSNNLDNSDEQSPPKSKIKHAKDLKSLKKDNKVPF